MKRTRWLWSLCMLAMLALVLSGCDLWIAGKDGASGDADIAPAPTDAPPPETGDVTLSATLEAPATLDSGESLPLIFTLTNHSDADLYVLTWLTPFEGIANEIFRVTRDGEVLAYEGPLVMRGDPTREDYLFLAAGTSASATVELATTYDLSKPGSYTIAYTADLLDIARGEDEMVESTGDLKQVVIPANTVTVTVDTATANSEPEPDTSGDPSDGASGTALYVNEDYGFSFRYPATWTLEEAGEQRVMLTQGGLRLAIAFQAPGNDPPGLGGLPAGELKTVGTMVFMGEAINKQAVVYKGKVKVLLCDARAGDLLFAFRLDDVIAADYVAVEIPETAEQDMAAILASFELLSAEVPASGQSITGTVGDIVTTRIARSKISKVLGDALFSRLITSLKVSLTTVNG